MIVDEDEPYQDSDDDEDDDEPRNIPVKSVTPAIPSTLPEDTVTSERRLRFEERREPRRKQSGTGRKSEW